MQSELKWVSTSNFLKCSRRHHNDGRKSVDDERYLHGRGERAGRSAEL